MNIDDVWELQTHFMVFQLKKSCIKLTCDLLLDPGQVCLDPGVDGRPVVIALRPEGDETDQSVPVGLGVEPDDWATGISLFELQGS